MQRTIGPELKEEYPCVCGAQVVHVCFRGVNYWRCEKAATGCDGFGKTYEEALSYAEQQLKTTRRLTEATSSCPPSFGPKEPSGRGSDAVRTLIDIPLADLSTEDDQSLLKHLIAIGASELDGASNDHEAYSVLGHIAKSAFVLGRRSALRLS